MKKRTVILLLALALTAAVALADIGGDLLRLRRWPRPEIPEGATSFSPKLGTTAFGWNSAYPVDRVFTDGAGNGYWLTEDGLFSAGAEAPIRGDAVRALPLENGVVYLGRDEPGILYLFDGAKSSPIGEKVTGFCAGGSRVYYAAENGTVWQWEAGVTRPLRSFGAAAGIGYMAANDRWLYLETEGMAYAWDRENDRWSGWERFGGSHLVFLAGDTLVTLEQPENLALRDLESGRTERKDLGLEICEFHVPDGCGVLQGNRLYFSVIFYGNDHYNIRTQQGTCCLDLGTGAVERLDEKYVSALLWTDDGLFGLSRGRFKKLTD